MTDELQKLIDSKTITATNNGDFYAVLMKSDVEEIIESILNPKSKDMVTVDMNDNTYTDKA